MLLLLDMPFEYDWHLEKQIDFTVGSDACCFYCENKVWGVLFNTDGCGKSLAET